MRGRVTKRIGKYRLIAEIGRGGMATVYLALAEGPAGVQKLVVVKVRKGDGDEPELDALFVDECRLAARFNHPHVVQVYEVGEEGDRMFIAMEYLEGQPWSRIRSKHSDGAPLLTSGQIARVFAEMLSGLHHAHELRDFDGTPLHVVHRDVTPQNVFVTYDGHAKLVDFGVAKAATASQSTRTGVLKGKVTYMSPEQARGMELDRRSDLFSVGIMLWEALAGKRMWAKSMTDVAVLTKLAQGDIPSLRAVAPDVDEALLAICERALAVERDERFATAEEMQHALEAYADQQNVRTRDIGRACAEAFRSSRDELKNIVDNAMRGFRESSTDLVRIDLGKLVPTPSVTSLGEGFAAVSPSEESARTAATVATSAVSVGSPPQPRRAPMAMLAAIALGTGLLTAVVLLVAVKSRANPGPVPTAPEPRAAASPPMASAASVAAPSQGTSESTVRISIQGVPADAKILLDAKLLGVGPFDGRVPSDGKTHELRVEASGYEPFAESIGVARDVVLKIPLAKAKRGAGGPAPKPVGGPTEAPPAEPVKPVKPAKPEGELPDIAPPAREIDPTDPYRKQ